jgi:hypothetical protein
MTAPKYDLTACVEAAAKAVFLKHWNRQRLTNPPIRWEHQDAMVQHFHREHVLPIVTAVLAVVEVGK